ncbi:hypothetical protein ACHHYP_12059 [Achlya hypogyna]|uniref:DDE-1 domain-containing protein n=1 Tax=Achlya hypogyna TaxID=1202772 RepID=A0A1V9YHM4_ACHHY|nr:hypothetical protein ACHHYP_12059 [Achlya hypogyna]
MIEFRENLDEKVLLLWDDFSAYWTPDVVTHAVTIGVLHHRAPPGYTWISQPADVVWNHTLKSAVRRKWVENLRLQLPCTIHPSILAAWVQDAWSSLKTSTIQKGFARCELIPPVTTLLEDDKGRCRAMDNELLETLVGLKVADHVQATTTFSLKAKPVSAMK